MVRYVRETGYLDSASTSLLQPLVRLLVRGRVGEEVVGEEGVGLLKGEEEGNRGAKEGRSAAQEGVQVIFCSLGLLGSYSTWGYLQVGASPGHISPDHLATWSPAQLITL